MSSEDFTLAICSERNDEKSSDALLTGTDTENKYVIHEVVVEIMETDEDIKPEITMLDENSVPNIPSEEVKDVNENMVLDEVSAHDIPSEEVEKVSEITMLDESSAPNITLEQVEDIYEITLEQLKEENEITVLDKDATPDIPSEEVKDVNENMMLDEDSAPGTIADADKELHKSIVLNEETDPQDGNDTEARIGDAIEENELPDHIHTYPDPRRMRPIIEERVMPPMGQKGNVQLFTEDSGPQLYKAKGNLVTAPIITKNLPKVFDFLPIHGKPQDSNNLNEYFSHKIREFVGCGLTDDEFQQLEDYCSPEQLKTGDEIEMETSVPVMGVIDGKFSENFEPQNIGEPPDLCILKKNKLRIDKDNKGLFIKKLKYRGVRNLPFTQEVYHMPLQKPTADNPDVDLEPGKDILYRVRVYRPYVYSQVKDRYTRSRHSVFSCDIVLTGRNKLSDLRDRFVCHNDFDMRVDVSNHPDTLPSAKAKEVFPSGFLFINNVFYVDTREGCVDYSEPIRDWARKKDLGVFPKKDMCAVRLEELTLKLGYPEVYVHQGNCEHVFLFSEVRLLNPTDPPRLYNYPCATAIAQNQTVYCTTCAEFSAKWIVVGCNRVPFDPAFFCDTCFRQYLYIDGQKIGEFKAYSYRGNALNLLKPQ